MDLLHSDDRERDLPGRLDRSETSELLLRGLEREEALPECPLEGASENMSSSGLESLCGTAVRG